jgi:hypothetical protein
MALHNNSNLYTGGATVVDTSPYTNFAINMDAKRKAKEEALDQYYRSLDKQVNPAGMRTQDIPVLMENENARREYYRQNRGAIMNPRLDGGRAQTEYQNMFQKSLGTVQQSKSAADVYKTLAPVLADPDKRQRMMRSTMHSIQQHDLPINDPNFKQFNISELAYDPKPLDLKTHMEAFKDIKMDKIPTIVGRDKNNMTRTVAYDYKLGDEAKAAVYNISSAQLNGKSFDTTITDLSEKIKAEGEDSPTFKQYNDVFKKNFGGNIQSKEDLAAAFNVGNLQSSRRESEIKDDAFGQKKAMAYLNDGLIRGRMKLSDEYARGRIDYKNATTAAAKDSTISKFIKGQVAEGKSPTGKKTIDGESIKAVTVDGQKFEGTEVRMPTFVDNQFATQVQDKDGNKVWEDPKTYLISNDMRYVIPVFPRKDKDGKILKGKSGNFQVDVERSKPRLIEDYRGILGKEWLSKNQVGDEVVDDFSDGNEDAPQAPTSTTTSTRTTERRKTEKLAKPTNEEGLYNNLGIKKH